MTPAASPMQNAAGTETNPEAGVTVASPATMPDAAPSTLGLPLCSHSVAGPAQRGGGGGKMRRGEAAGGERPGVSARCRR